MPDKQTVLVTGGAGYIGSHVCKELASAGYNPVVYDNLCSGVESAVKWGQLIVGDILDTNLLDKTIKNIKPAAIIHMAAFLAAGESIIRPEKYFHNNTFGALSIINAMNNNNLRHIVFSSTAATYGHPSELPLTESARTHPINPYGRSKLFVEQMLADFEVSHGVKYAALRYFNAVGADLEGEIGCNQSEPTNLLPILMEVQNNERNLLEVFGNDYDTPDGTAIRDYIHVTDLAKAHIKAVDYIFSNEQSITLNLGVGKGNSVLDIINATEKVTGKKVPFKITERREGDPAILTADASKAERILNWKAEITSLEEIIASAWKWHRKIR